MEILGLRDVVLLTFHSLYESQSIASSQAIEKLEYEF